VKCGHTHQGEPNEDPVRRPRDQKKHAGLSGLGCGWNQERLPGDLCAGASRFLRRFPDFFGHEKGADPTQVDSLPNSATIERVSQVLFRTPENRARHLAELISEIWWGTAVGSYILFAFLIIDDLNEAIRIASADRKSRWRRANVSGTECWRTKKWTSTWPPAISLG
jgi:hypothetical protein